MPQPPEEWLRQADYDMDTADHMFGGGRYFYAVFMCHLSIEKALKGLYRKKLSQDPPRVHNLIYLLNKVSMKPPEPIARFIVKLNEPASQPAIRRKSASSKKTSLRESSKRFSAKERRP